MTKQNRLMYFASLSTVTCVVLLGQNCAQSNFTVAEPNSESYVDRNIDEVIEERTLGGQDRNIASVTREDLGASSGAGHWYKNKKGVGISRKSSEINSADARFPTSVPKMIQEAASTSQRAKKVANEDQLKWPLQSRKVLLAAKNLDSLTGLANKIMDIDVQKDEFLQLIAQAEEFQKNATDAAKAANFSESTSLRVAVNEIGSNAKNISNIISATFAYRSQSVNKLGKLKANWYYSWGLNPLKMNSNRSVSFVPMIWKTDIGNSNTVEDLQKLLATRGGKKFKYIMLYNEPNREDQADTTPEEGASYINNNYVELKKFSEFYVSPVSSGPGDNWTGNIEWLSLFFSLLEEKLRPLASEAFIKVLAYHHYPDPIKLKLMPENSNPENPKDAFYKKPNPTIGRATIDNTENIEYVGRKLANIFLQRIHFTYRAYGIPLWITEFGIADWGSTNCFNKETSAFEAGCTMVKNRISPSIVKKFLEIVLPELYSRDYVRGFAYFTNSENYNEQLKASAIFKSSKDVDGFVRSSELTDVGELYAKYNYNSSCTRTENSNSEGKYFEQQSLGCPASLRTFAGWKLDKNNLHWTRTLTREEAGDFSSLNKKCKTNRWRRNNNPADYLIVETKSQECFPEVSTNKNSFTDSSGRMWVWNNRDSYRREIDPTKEKIR